MKTSPDRVYLNSNLQLNLSLLKQKHKILSPPCPICSIANIVHMWLLLFYLP